eukprot:8861905-Lingulodinium_polyedra.AAC.1
MLKELMKLPTTVGALVIPEIFTAVSIASVCVVIQDSMPEILIVHGGCMYDAIYELHTFLPTGSKALGKVHLADLFLKSLLARKSAARQGW